MMRRGWHTHALGGGTLLLMAACQAPQASMDPSVDVESASFAAPLPLELNTVGTFQVKLARRFAQQVPTSVTFPSGSAILSDTARNALIDQAKFIRTYPELIFRVYGHSDNRGEHKANVALAQKRAEAVLTFLATQGVDASQMDPAYPVGQAEPRDLLNATSEMNRRTVTEVSGVNSQHPMILAKSFETILDRPLP